MSEKLSGKKLKKKYIDKDELKQDLINYIENDCSIAEKRLFEKTLVEFSHCIIFSLSINERHPAFDDLVQESLFKLYQIIKLEERLNLKLSSNQIFCYIFSVIHNTVILYLRQFYKYSYHIKFGDIHNPLLNGEVVYDNKNHD